MSAATTTTFLPYTLTLRAPAITTALSGDPNSAATQPFIPGSAIRGAVAARLLAEGQSADGGVFRELVLSGDVRYLHAYPEIEGHRALPAPLSWRSEKQDPDRARDLAAFAGHVSEDDDAEDLAEIWPEEALVSVGGPFVTPSTGAGVRAVATPRIGARLHQQRDRVKGRPWMDQTLDGQEVPQGAIFAYEYLERGQVFRGAIQVHLRATSPADVEGLDALRVRYVHHLKDVLARPILVGRSRRAGYGGDAEVAFEAEASREYENVSGILSHDVGNGDLFRMLLVSAYIGRHPETGQVDPTALDHELRLRRLNADVERRFWSFETVGSFNLKWRLEVPQATAGAAGSVLLLKAQKPIPLLALQAVERDGLGERRVEGFGRVLFLRHDDNIAPIALRRGALDIAASDRQGSSRTVDSGGSEQLAFLEQRVVLSAARIELARLAADLANRAKKLPTSSLLGRVRTLFRGVRDDTTAHAAFRNLRIWCDEDHPSGLKPVALKKLRACQVDRRPLLEWLGALAKDVPSEGAWPRLMAAVGSASTLTGLSQHHHVTTRSAADGVLRSHATELSIHVIDEVLATMARRNRGRVR